MSDLLSRVTRLEYGFIAACLAAIVAGFTLFTMTGNRIDALTDRIGKMETSLAEVKGDVKVVDSRLVGVEKKIDGMDAKLDKLLEK